MCRWQKRLWHYVFRVTDDVHGAWDITQECWLQIIKKIGRLNDPASFGPWAYRIATNKSMDWLKRKKRQGHLPLDSIQLGSDQKTGDLQVRELVRGLKDASRVILSLYYFEQLSVGEISDVLNIPSGTVKSRLSKARAELKQSWERLDDNPSRRKGNGQRTD